MTRYLVATATLVALALAWPIASATAQNGSTNGDRATAIVAVHKPNYELASKWTAAKVGKLIFDTSVTPHWLETSDRFWYSYETSKGKMFNLVDPARKTKAPLFDNAKMAAQLSTLTRSPFDAQHLPIAKIKFMKNDTAFQFEVEVPKDAEVPGEKKPEATEKPDNPKNKTLGFEYDLATGKVTLLPDYTPTKKPRWVSVSPDDKTAVFARNHNLYMMDAASYALAQKDGEDKNITEIQLTTDGEENYSYARRLNDEDRRELKINNDEDLKKNPRVPPVTIYWSKDSKKLSLVRQDQRKVADLWVINSLANPRPKLETYRYGMPGEENQPQAEMQIFDVATKAQVMVKDDLFKDQTLNTITAPSLGRNREKEKTEPQWLSDTADKLYFLRQSRDFKKVDVCVADTTTGEVKVLIEERLNTYIETKPLRLIGNGAELIWWSERDGWGHYYLYANNGQLKNQITSGEFVTNEIAAVDEKARAIYVSANGREVGEDPYYEHLYRINLDGAGMRLLNPGNATHDVSASDSGLYFVDTSSRINSAPESVLLDTTGGKLALETTDVSAALEAGFKYPETFRVKADDGITDLYGVMYKPFDFDPAKKYPIIAFVYPGPQTESVTKSFSPRQQNVALAQFGFIVVEVGNRGGHPQRSKWYHNYGYGNLRDYGLADKKAAIEQLSRRHSFIDIERVGIYGHSGGGFMSTAAMLVYPDFFKVAVSSSGNHENNVYNRSWSEKHHGVRETTDKDGKVKFEYDIEKNSELAKNLKGRLLLTTGDMDDNVHMAGTLRMAEALIKANKRFDLFIFPGKRHAYADMNDYFFWLRADYFSRHLMGESASTVDLIELAREKEQVGEKRK